MTTPNDLEYIADRIGSGKARITSRIDRCWQILRYYSWQRLAIRGSKLVLQKLSSSQTQLPSINSIESASYSGSARSETLRRCIQIIAQDHGQRPGQRSTDVAQGIFRLLNHEVNLGRPILWDQADRTTHLWRFQFQYHEFLLPGLERSESVPQATWEFLENWLKQHIDEQQIDKRSDAWHPYCISRRIPVWLWLVLAGSPPEDLKSKLHRGLLQQIHYLADNLETDIGGNHLLENYHAILLCSVLLQGTLTDKHEQVFLSGLQREMVLQITPHGEHFERSPMYHCHILSNALILRVAYMAMGRDIPLFLIQQTESMIRFVSQVLHPDGEIPLFSDSGFAEALSVHSIRQLVQLCGLDWPEKTATGPVGDCWIHRENEDMLIVDAGPVAAPSLPAHGHCDTVSFEASIDGQRWFVDSGNFDYEDGSMRRYCRSSLAHNVITVNRDNHCSIWSKFRMGKRSRILDRKSGRAGERSWFDCTYRLATGHHAKRMFVCCADYWLCIDNVLFTPRSCPNPVVEGWLHLSPSIVFAPLSKFCCNLQRGSEQRYIHFWGSEPIATYGGWYCPAFGTRERSIVLSYPRTKEGKFFGWVLSKNREIEVSQDESSLALSIRGEGDAVRCDVWNWAEGQLSLESSNRHPP